MSIASNPFDGVVQDNAEGQIQVPEAPEVLINNETTVPVRRNWFQAWNGYLRKKNWICIYFALIELVSLAILMLVWTSDSNYLALMAIPFIVVVLDFFHIAGVSATQRGQDSSARKINVGCPLFVNLLKFGLCIGFYVAATKIKENSEMGFAWLIPTTIFVCIADMGTLEDERIDGRGGPLKFYENFDYILIYSQWIMLSIVFTNQLGSFNWANIFIPTFILMFLKCLKVLSILFEWICICMDLLCSCKVQDRHKCNSDRQKKNWLIFADAMPFPFMTYFMF